MEMRLVSRLERALKKAVKDPSRAAQRLDSVADEEVRSAAEAEMVVQLLTTWPLPEQQGDVFGSALHELVGFMQGPANEDTLRVFRERGAPELLRIFDDTIEGLQPEPDDEDAEDADFDKRDDLMFLLKVVCQYCPPGGVQRVAQGLRSVALQDEYLWTVILGLVAEDDHPWTADLVRTCAEPLPSGFAAVAFVDMTNAVARADRLSSHPFDSGAGRTLLEAWLSDRDESNFSYAHSAAAAIPFLSPPLRSRIQALADTHPSEEVQLEAAWGAARAGAAAGFERLARACGDPRTAGRPMAYLEELGATECIPEHARSEEFRATAEMCEWLAHPQEYGRPPDAIELRDKRELYWPPTDDRRVMYLFRYSYPPDPEDEDDGPDVGHGLVGSVTFALFGEATGDRTPEEVYGLHCAWELGVNEDRRAPRMRTAKAGIRILARDNPGFGAG